MRGCHSCQALSVTLAYQSSYRFLLLLTLFFMFFFFECKYMFHVTFNLRENYTNFDSITADAVTYIIVLLIIYRKRNSATVASCLYQTKKCACLDLANVFSFIAFYCSILRFKYIFAIFKYTTLTKARFVCTKFRFYFSQLP